MKDKKGICQMGLVLAAALTLLFSCSDARDQYDRSNYTGGDSGSDTSTLVNPQTIESLEYDGSGNKISTGGANTEGQLSTEEEDRRIRENRVKPIIYDEGLIAGIDMKTTFEEASDILSTPDVYETSSGPIYVYGEGIQIFWRENAPRYPSVVFVNSDYEGSLDTKDADLGKLYIGKSIADLYGPEEELGESYMKRLYTVLHGTERDFDCVKARRCQIRYFQESNAILYMLPKLIMRVSSDRKEIADMRVVRDESSAEQNAPFDIIRGSFTSPEGKTLTLGQTYADLVAFQKVPTEYFDPSTNGMSVRYGNVYNVTTRSDYDRAYKKPVDSEVLKAFYLSNDFENVFTINGEVLNYTFDEAAKTYSLQKGAFEGSEPMVMKLAFDKNKGLKGLQVPFLDDLRTLILDGMKELPGMTGYSSWGRNYIKDTDYMNNSVYSYDPLTNTGRAVFFSMDRIQGNLSYIESDMLVSPFNKMVANAYFNPASVDLGSPIKNHGEFNLGDMVEFEKLDSTKESVTLKMKGLQERVSIDEHTMFRRAPIGEGKFSDIEVMTVNPSNFPLTLILDKQNMIKGISFSLSQDQAFTLGCGDQKVDLFFGSSDASVEMELAKITACQKVFEFSTDGANQLETIYLPELKLMLNFSENDFSSVTTYQD